VELRECAPIEGGRSNEVRSGFVASCGGKGWSLRMIAKNAGVSTANGRGPQKTSRRRGSVTITTSQLFSKQWRITVELSQNRKMKNGMNRCSLLYADSYQS